MSSRRARRKPGVFQILSMSPEETQRIGSELAQSLTVPSVVLLRGALGTGKTTLARGIALGLGIDDPGRVISPSFTLVNLYHGVCPIYHVDLYRLEGERDLGTIGLDDFLGTEGVTIIEWSEKMDVQPEKAMEVELEDAGGDLRVLRIKFPNGGKVSCSRSTARSRKRR